MGNKFITLANKHYHHHHHHHWLKSKRQMAKSKSNHRFQKDKLLQENNQKKARSIQSTTNKHLRKLMLFLLCSVRCWYIFIKLTKNKIEWIAFLKNRFCCFCCFVWQQQQQQHTSGAFFEKFYQKKTDHNHQKYGYN